MKREPDISDSEEEKPLAKKKAAAVKGKGKEKDVKPDIKPKKEKKTKEYVP